MPFIFGVQKIANEENPVVYLQIYTLLGNLARLLDLQKTKWRMEKFSVSFILGRILNPVYNFGSERKT